MTDCYDRSYQTPNGVISGIQWLPAETTSILPHGALSPVSLITGIAVLVVI